MGLNAHPIHIVGFPDFVDFPFVEPEWPAVAASFENYGSCEAFIIVLFSLNPVSHYVNEQVD